MATQNMSQTPLRSRSPDGAGMEQVLNPASTLERSRMASCSSAKGIFLFWKKSIPILFLIFFKGTEQEQALLDLQQVHDNNALIGHIKKPMLSREGTVDSEMLDFATENITTLHPDDSAEVVDSNGAEGKEMFRITIKYKGLNRAKKSPTA